MVLIVLWFGVDILLCLQHLNAFYIYLVESGQLSCHHLGEIAAHSAHDILSLYLIVNKIFPPRFLEWDFCSECARPLSKFSYFIRVTCDI